MQPNLITGAEALAVRKKLRLNQSDFWRPLLVAQSCGSRYESGREIPGPVQVLFCLFICLQLCLLVTMLLLLPSNHRPCHLQVRLELTCSLALVVWCHCLLSSSSACRLHFT